MIPSPLSSIPSVLAEASMGIAAIERHKPADLHELHRACSEEITRARHLEPAEKAEAQRLLSTLFATGAVTVPDPFQRTPAVAGIQWAMERSLQGHEIIVTQLLCTPLRTLGEAGAPPAQKARADALIERLEDQYPLRLVYCADGGGNCSQAGEALLADSDRRFIDLLRIDRLSYPPADFDPKYSGAVILGSGALGPIAFAIQAAQADKAGTERMELLLGRDTRGSPLSDALSAWEHMLPHAAQRELRRWRDGAL
jgi:hypothetical protein